MATNNLDKALEQINKKFGKGTIQLLGDTPMIKESLLSSGSLMIDKILGGGIGYGRITEIYGVESSGKTTLALQFVRECQKAGGKAAYIDVENALDVEYAKVLGVDTDNLLFSQPSSGEQALEVVDLLSNTGEVDLIVVDSVAALTPQAELDGEMGDQNIGLLARLMSKAMRKLTGTLNVKHCAIIFINQIREKVNTGFSMGPSETTTGGRALRFFASQRIELRKTTAIKEGADVIGNKVKVKIVKNKIAPPMKVAEIPMIYGKGFDGANEAFELALEYGICQQSGAYFTTHDGNRFQGKLKFKEYYEETPEALNELLSLVKEKILGIEVEPEYEVDPKTGEVIE